MTVLRDSVFMVVWVERDPDDHARAGYKLGEHLALGTFRKFSRFTDITTAYGHHHGFKD